MDVVVLPSVCVPVVGAVLDEDEEPPAVPVWLVTRPPLPPSEVGIESASTSHGVMFCPLIVWLYDCTTSFCQAPYRSSTLALVFTRPANWASVRNCWRLVALLATEV